MFFIAGFGSRIRERSPAKGICPACGEIGFLHIVRESQTLSLFFIPVASFGGKYLATCTACASVMELSREAGKRCEKDPTGQIGYGELTVLKNNYAAKCPCCGRKIFDDHIYCPRCGEKV